MSVVKARRNGRKRAHATCSSSSAQRPQEAQPRRVHSKGASKSFEKLLSKYPSLSIKETKFGDKVVDSSTGHEFKIDKNNNKASMDKIVTYLNSKSYKRGIEKWYKDEEFEKYAPHIVPHKENPKKLYCLITRTTLNKIPSQVEKHVHGKRFKKQLKEREELQKTQKEIEEKRKKRKQRK